MSQTEMNLDQLLADLAEDVPPMPADFHDKWMNAVRAEAKQAETEAPAASPVSQWPRILSIAAVFVFLIGGTFIYRSTRKTMMPVNGSDSTVTVTESVRTEATTLSATAMEKAADSAGESGPVMDTAGETGFSTARPAADGPMMNMAEEIPASKANSKAAETDSAAEAPVVGMAMDAAGETAYEAAAPEEAEEAAEAPVVEMAMDAAGETAYEAAAPEEAKEAEKAESAVNMAMEAPAAESSETQAPVKEDQATEVPTREDRATEAPATVPAAREGIGGFFADMGDFLLTVWPYLLIVLVLAGIAVGWKKVGKK